MLLEGHFAKNLKIMTGHNADEGPLFANPGIMTSSDYAASLESGYPGISQAASNYIQNVLYPSKLDGSYGYKSQVQRAILSISESVFTCNTNYLARAYGNKTYSYQFSVPPAFHGEDVPFTYYNGNVTAVFGFPNIAITLQQFITSFAETGVPSAMGAPKFPTYGSNAQVMNINVTGLGVIKDSNANERCYWWQKGLFN
jgi:acetylcholinesterase